MRLVVLLGLLLPSASAAEAGVGSDVKFIRCATCHEMVSALHAFVAAEKKASKKPLSEADVQSKVEAACAAEEREGAWLRSIDLVEDDKRLTLVKQSQEGPCGKECLTIAIACAALLEEGWESELGEALYTGATEADVRRQACTEWSSACRKPPPRLPSSRPAGPAFRPLSESERDRREQQGAGLLGAAPPPGTLSDAALMHAMGVQDAASADEHAGAWTGAEGAAGGPVSLNRLLEASAAFQSLGS